VIFPCLTALLCGNVHSMNGPDEKVLDTYRSFLLMAELDSGEALSQRELARRLGIALGLVNSYLKTLVAKGFVRITAFPRNRYAYLLTPRGITEKSRLAYQHLSYLTNLYRVARQDYLRLFRDLEEEGVRRVVFCGLDEVAEIAYLSLRETTLEMEAVLDDTKAGGEFFGRPVVTLAKGLLAGDHTIVLTSLKRGEALRAELLRRGAGPERIRATQVHRPLDGGEAC